MKKQEKIVFQQILVSFRAATCEDVNLLFRWVNNPEVRKNAFSQRKIGYSEHQRWFDKKLGNECSKIFIFTLGSQPVGQVRFEINRDGTAEIDVSIDRDYRGKGLAGNILHIASEFAVTQLGISTIFTHIKPDNKRSVRAFKKAGYCDKKTVFFRNHKCVELKFSDSQRRNK